VKFTRAALPPTILRMSRRRLPELEHQEAPLTSTGPLGDGGRADSAARTASDA
jgi:hypothetical protein